VTAATTASAITLSLGIGTLTTGTPQAATASGVTVSTTQDFASAGVCVTSAGRSGHRRHVAHFGCRRFGW
jgi:hypothetical protein